MPHINLENQFPGITGLLEYRQDTGAPIRELTQLLMRGPSSLSETERELIATIVSLENGCRFCTQAHAATADLYLGNCENSEVLLSDLEKAPFSEKTKALLEIAKQVQKGGKHVTQIHIDNAKSKGASDMEIHDTVLIAALFCLYNRYVDGLATVLPDDQSYFQTLANKLVTHGYKRVPNP